MRKCPALIAVCGLAALWGCTEIVGPSSQEFEPADFRAAVVPEAPEGASAKATPGPNIVPIHVNEADDHLVDIGTLVGPPPADPSPLQPPALAGSEAVVLDSLVGQINGRPVYASEFLGPLEGRLRGLSNEFKDDAQWREAAAEAIARVLIGRLKDELFITEAQASLNPEQKKGLLHFIDKLREDLVSTAGAGAAAAADEVYRERNDGRGGLDAEVKKNVDEEMVGFQMQTKVAPLVNVSWKDVQLEYERRYAEFNPPATAVFRMIYIPDSKPEALAEFTRLIGAGEDFTALASRPENDFLAKDGGLWSRTFEREFADGKFFADNEYNEAAHLLKPGETSAPIHIKKRTAWIHLEKIDRPASKSLYDVQVMLYNQLHRQRVQLEAERYFRRLMNKASFSDINSMVSQLVTIAHDRYYVPKR